MIIRRERQTKKECSTYTFKAELGAPDVRRYICELIGDEFCGLGKEPITESDFRYPLERVVSQWPFYPFKTAPEPLKDISAWYFQTALYLGLLTPSADRENYYLFTDLAGRKVGRPKKD